MTGVGATGVQKKPGGGLREDEPGGLPAAPDGSGRKRKRSPPSGRADEKPKSGLPAKVEKKVTPPGNSIASGGGTGMRNAAGPANREIVVAKGGAKPGVSAAEGIGDSTLVPLRLVRTTGIAAQPEAAPGAGVEERGARSSSGRGAFTGLGVLSLTGPTSPLTDDEMADLAFTSIQMLTGGVSIKT